MEKIDTDYKRNFSRCTNLDAGSLRGMLGLKKITLGFYIRYYIL